MMSSVNRIVGVLFSVWCGVEIAVAAPAAQSDSRFVLIVGGELQTAEHSQPLMQVKTIHANDHLILTITASRAVSVFVAYCDSQAEQQVYGPLAVSPEGTVDVPDDGYFIADNHPGREHVFVVASVEPLQNSDPKLDRILRLQNTDHTCGAPLAMTTMESRNQPTGEGPDSLNTASIASQTRANVATVAARRRPSNYPVAAGPTRVRGFEVRKNNAARAHTGGTLATQSDNYGIAIVALTFDHR